MILKIVPPHSNIPELFLVQEIWFIPDSCCAPTNCNKRNLALVKDLQIVQQMLLFPHIKGDSFSHKINISYVNPSQAALDYNCSTCVQILLSYKTYWMLCSNHPLMSDKADTSTLWILAPLPSSLYGVSSLTMALDTGSYTHPLCISIEYSDNFVLLLSRCLISNLIS